MKNKLPLVLLLILLAILLVLLVITGSTREPYFMIVSQKVLFLVKICGMLIATLAAVLLLLRAISSHDDRPIWILTLPLLGGLALSAAHWSVILGLVAIVLGLMLKEFLAAQGGNRSRPGRFKSPSESSPHPGRDPRRTH